MIADELLTIIGKYKKPIALVTAIISACIVSFWLFITFAIVYVDISNKDSGSISVYTSSDYGTKKASGGGITVVSRKTKSLIAESNTRKTQSSISIPWYGFVYKKIILMADKNAEKAAFNNSLAGECASYSSNLQRLLSYTCSSNVSLLEYQTPPNGKWTSKNIAGLSYGSQAWPYLGGVLGISSSESTDTQQKGDIVRVTENGQLLFYQPPDAIPASSVNQLRVFTDKNDPTNNRFILVDTTTGTVYLATPTDNDKNIAYEKTDPPSDYNPSYNQTLCSINGSSAYCYRGQSPVGDRPASFDPLKITIDSITTFSFDNPNQITINLKNTTHFVLHDFFVTTDGLFYGKSYKKLYYFMKNKDDYTPVELSQNIDGAAAGKDIYFIQDRGVFKVNPQTLDANQVFASPNITPRALYSSTNLLFVIGWLQDNQKTTYAYRLTDEDNATPNRRLIDLFPISANNLPDTISTDLVGTTMQISVNMDRDFNASTFENRKLNIIDQLKSRGIQTDDYKILFTY